MDFCRCIQALAMHKSRLETQNTGKSLSGGPARVSLLLPVGGEKNLTLAISALPASIFGGSALRISDSKALLIPLLFSTTLTLH